MTPKLYPIIATLAIVILVASTAFAQSPSQAERFDRIDRNRDGKVTPDELPQAALFKRLDRNGDGVIERSEVGGTPDTTTPNRPRSAGTGDLVMPVEPPLKKHLNLRYDEIAGVDPNLLSLDLYVPDDTKAAAKRPVMIMIHGGGWRNGDKASPPIVGAKMRHFVGHGYVYASINYRLSSQTAEPNGVEHPMHAMDCAKAIGWIHDHVAEYGGDPAQLHLMGHSAGGHLAAILGTNERFLKAQGKDLSILKSNVLLDPAAIDIPRYIELENGRAMTALYELAFGNDEANQLDASPQQHISTEKHIPPTLLFYAGDRMKLNVLASAFVEALNKAGVPAAAVDTITLDHGQINSHIGMVDEPMTALIMRLHAGEDVASFPPKLDGQAAEKPDINSRREPPPARPRKSDSSAWITPAVEAHQVEFHTFQSEAAGTEVSFHLFKPEAYEKAKDQRFPVLYWLHGTEGGLAGIAPLSAYFDRAMRDGKIPPMLIAFPNGRPASMWCDAKDGSLPVETIVVKELVPHIDATFRTIANREGRILEGFSMGGYGAARLGFKYPDLFAAISIFAGGPLDLDFQGPRATGNPAERNKILQATFGGDLDYFRSQSPFTIAERNATAIQGKVRIRQVVGSRDVTAELNRSYSTHLRKLGIEHEFVEVPGVGHDTMALLQALDDRFWEFYRVTLAATATPPPMPAASTKPVSSAARPSSPPSVSFKRDYQAGTKDARGQFMGGTETMRLAAHDGKLFAALGYWTDQPGDDPSPGAQILVKRGPDAAWELDRSFPGALRVNCMEPVTFTTDGTGKKLAQPVPLLLADAGLNEAHTRGGALSVWVRDDAANQWVESRVTDRSKRAYIRAFGFQRDSVTGVEHVFAGTGAGEVFAGVYDPQSPGRIRWNPTPEYANPDFDGSPFRRCQGFCVANGKAYASISPSLVERTDGANPSWREVFRWKPTGDRAGQGLRGITGVPDPKGGGHEVILGSREQEGRILRIDPMNGYEVTDELNSSQFLKEQLGGFRGGKLVAYNRFEPGKDPRTGQLIHWVTVAGVKPGDRQAAWLMIRQTDGTYEPIRVFDPSLEPHPLLATTRTLEFAPWNPREFYTGGFDGAANERRNHNSAWIFKGTLTGKQP